MKKSVQELKLHDHTCLIFKNPLEFFHSLVPFIREGIKNNEKCLVVIDDITREEVLTRFKYVFKTKAEALEQANSLRAITIEYFKSIYLEDGTFNIKRTSETYLSILKDVISNGYSGLRVLVELSSSLKSLMKANDFLMWEEEADKFFPDNNFLAICAYNKNYFTDEYTSKAIKIHPIEVDLLKTRL